MCLSPVNEAKWGETGWLLRERAVQHQLEAQVFFSANKIAIGEAFYASF